MSARATFSPFKDRKIPTLEVEVKNPHLIQEKNEIDQKNENIPVQEKVFTSEEVKDLIEKKPIKKSQTRSKNQKLAWEKRKGIEQPSPLQKEKKAHSTEFYIGLALGILVVCIGGYFIYTKVKKWYDSEDQYLQRLQAEGIENVKIN